MSAVTRFFRLLGLCTLLGLGEAVAAGPIMLELRKEAMLDHQRITLDDVALVHGDLADAARLARLDLGPVPRIGHVDRLTREQIERALRRSEGIGATGIVWSGAASVSIRTATRIIGAAAIAQAASSAFLLEFGARYPGIAVTLAAPVADLEVTTGHGILRARALQGRPVSAHFTVWLDAVVDGNVCRSAIVPLNVTLSRAAYVAVRDIKAGANVLPQDVEVREVNVAGAAVIPVGAPFEAGQWRVRRGLRAGQLLTEEGLAAADAVLRGDAVRLRASTGAIGIETGAVALADALPGQMLTVLPNNGSAVVTGRLGQLATVHLD